MKAIQIVELTGPDSALELVDLPEPEPTHMLTVRARGRADRGALRRGRVPGAAADPRPVPDQTAAAVRPRQRGRRCRSQRARRRGREDGRPRGGVLRARRVCRDRGGAPVPDVRAWSGARLRAGGGPDPQLPHRLLLARPAWAAARGRDGAGPRGRRRRGYRGAAGREGLGARTIAVVSSEVKEQVAMEAGADHVVRSDGRGRTRRRSSPAAAWRSCSTRSADRSSPTACARCARSGRLIVVGFAGGSIPEVKVNRLLLGNTEIIGAGWGGYAMSRPRGQPGDRGRPQPSDRTGVCTADRRRALCTGARRGRAARDRRAPRDRQGCPRRSLTAWTSSIHPARRSCWSA